MDPLGMPRSSALRYNIMSGLLCKTSANTAGISLKAVLRSFLSTSIAASCVRGSCSGFAISKNLAYWGLLALRRRISRLMAAAPNVALSSSVSAVVTAPSFCFLGIVIASNLRLGWSVTWGERKSRAEY